MVTSFKTARPLCTSIATNIVGDDTNGREDVFVRDRQTGTTSRVSVGSNGEQGDLDSLTGAIDADGGVVAFWSDASTLVSENGQSFFAYDIFVRDARPTADLSLTLADSADPVAVHGDLTYSATIRNVDSTAATGVTFVADLPANASFVSASGAACTGIGNVKSGGRLTCVVGTLGAGSSLSVIIRVRPAKPGTLSLSGTVYADQPDAHRTDNSATETTTITR